MSSLASENKQNYPQIHYENQTFQLLKKNPPKPNKQNLR